MKWISVKDKLPQHGQEVIATNGKEVTSTFCHIWHNGPSWSNFARNPTNGPVTHWMPFPDPPKENI